MAATNPDPDTDRDTDPRFTEPVDDPDVIHELVSKADIGDYDDCWDWTGPTSNGYGYLSYRGVRVPAHRLMVRVCRDAPLDSTHDTDHICGNKRCINPGHLQVLDRSAHIRVEHRRALDSDGSSKAGLTRPDIRSIRQRYTEGHVVQRELADEYGISIRMVSKIINREAYWYID